MLRPFFALVAGVSLFAVAPLAAQNNPIPESIVTGDLSLEVEAWLTAPATGSAPRTRLSMLKPAYDGSKRMFLADLNSPFYVISGDSMTTYIDLATVFPRFVDQSRLGTGFMSFAFHPEFKTNGKFYTAHTESAGSGPADFTSAVAQSINIQSVVTEWTATDPAAMTFSGTRREIMRVEYHEQVHNIQDIAFNPYVTAGHEDYGLLYICVGDGEAVAGGYPEAGHRLDSVHGTLVRIDPMGTNSANGRYGIPSSNPFVSDSNPATLGEIYAWGFRNPHRIFWDSAHPDRMFLVDIGERNGEELNLVVKGGDFGYSNREGTFVLDPKTDPDVVLPLPANDASFNYVYPVAQYDHDEGRAIAGGMVYRGTAAPQLYGKLIFGDIANGRVFYVDADGLELGKQAEIKELQLKVGGVNRSLLSQVAQSRTDLRFGTDEAGELFMTTKRDGKIRRIAGYATVQPPVTEPDNGTGLLTNLSTNTQVSADGLTAGFVITGGSRRVLIRGVGPGLAQFNITGVLADPVLEIRAAGNATPIAIGDNWSDEANAADILATANSLGAFPLTVGSKDASIMVMLPAGVYIASVKGAGGATGQAIVEVYRLE